MKYIISLLLFIPLVLHAEYNSVQIAFDIELKDGSLIHGYKEMRNHDFKVSHKKYLKNDLQLFLKNESVKEPGEYGYYSERIRYKYQSSYVYQLLDPKEIIISDIDTLIITELINDSFIINLTGTYTIEDTIWMNTSSIVHYTYNEFMCSNDVFIHSAKGIPILIQQELALIVDRYKDKIELMYKKIEDQIDSDEDYERLMKDLYHDREKALEPYFRTYKSLKKATVVMCTC